MGFFFQGSAVYCTVWDGAATRRRRSVWVRKEYVSGVLYLLWQRSGGTEDNEGENSNLFAIADGSSGVKLILGTRLEISIPFSTAFLPTRHPLAYFGRAVHRSFSRIHLGVSRDKAEKVCVGQRTLLEERSWPD